MRFLSIVSVVLIAAACGGSNTTGPQPVTGQYTAANAATLSMDPVCYALSINHQLAENGCWTQNGNTLTLTAQSSSAVSTLTVGDGTLDGFIYGTQRHFTRMGS